MSGIIPIRVDPRSSAVSFCLSDSGDYARSRRRAPGKPDVGLLGQDSGDFRQISSVNFFSFKYFTILPTSCECSRVVTRIASSVSTTTRLCTPTVAMNLSGA
jgi:hypothetical protein